MKNAPRHGGVTSHTIQGVKWSEQFNCYRAVVAGWLEMSFDYRSGEGFVVKVGGRNAVERCSNPKHAGRLAKTIALQLLDQAKRELLDGADSSTEEGKESEK